MEHGGAAIRAADGHLYTLTSGAAAVNRRSVNQSLLGAAARDVACE